MKNKKTVLSLLLLALLTGCGETNTATTEGNSEKKPDTEHTVPTLKNQMFLDAGKESVTYLEEIHTFNSSSENTAHLKTKFAKEKYFGSIVNEEDSDDILVSTAYYSKNGKVAYSTHPDRYNKVKEVTSSIRWEDSVYQNRLGDLTKDDFQYVSLDEFGIATYSLNENAIGNKAKKEIIDAIYDSATVYYHNGTGSKFGADSLSKMELYVSNNGITGFALKYSKTDSSGRAYTELSVTLEDLGTTTLSEEDVCPTPYTYEDSLKSKYNSLDQALKEMKSYNYQIAVDIKRGETLLQHSEGFFFKEGYSGYDKIISGSNTSYSYYGIHKRNDGKYERYTGSKNNELKGDIFRSSAHQGLMSFDFSYGIFEYDDLNSTSSKDIFQIRSDFMSYNYIGDIVEDMTYDEYATYAAGLTLSVENGHLTSFSFPFSDNLGNSYTFTEKITDHGNATTVPTSIADFSTYQEYVSPTSFKELEVGIMSLSDGSISSYTTGDDIIRSYLYNSQALNLLPFPLTGDSAFYYESSTFIPSSIIPAVLYLFFDPGSEEMSTVFRKVLNAINSSGYSLSQSDEKSATQTINSNYEISLDYSSGTLCLSYTTPYSFE